jgi:VanZ family protein
MRRGILHGIGNWGPVVLYLGLIFYLSSLSDVSWAGSTPDWASHSLEYLGLAILLARALNDGFERPAPVGRLALTFVLCVAYAGLDEVHQMFVPDRFADYRDVLADAAGAAMGLLGLYLAGRLFTGRRTA